MNIAEAIGAMRIIGPRMPDLAPGGTLSFVRSLVASMQRKDPVDALRLLALMRHEPLAATASAMKEAGMQRFLVALFDGLKANRLADLVEAAALLGFCQKGWSDA